jgi:hypothetical protein
MLEMVNQLSGWRYQNGSATKDDNGTEKWQLLCTRDTKKRNIKDKDDLH